MNILIIDSTSESQAAIASRIRSLSSEELDAMDITLQLSHPAHFDEKVLDCDLLILGPELDSFAHQLSLKASEANKDLSILR
ncbi:MAG: hypothetical protein KDD55_11075, partial [Bdellovibrionales bacterium]|nr:hypothetical protein [Bdellovibrionales bacterium]